MNFIAKVFLNFILCGIFSAFIYFVIFIFGGEPSYKLIFWTVFIVNGIIGMINYASNSRSHY